MPEPFYQKNFPELKRSSGEEKMPEIKELQRRIEKIENILEKTESVKEREEIVKNEIKKYLEDLQKMPSFAIPTKARDEAEEIKKFPPPQQVGTLIALVFDKGLEEAISVAKALNNPAILDEFHDTLVDRYYDVLIEKGVLKPS